MKGTLEKPCILTGIVDGVFSTVVFPAGCIVEITSDDSWDHTVSTRDIEDAIDLFKD